MSTDRDARITGAAAEHLLDEGTGHPALSALFQAATSPAAPSELAAEQDVLTAFRAAAGSPSPSPRRPSMIKTTVAKLIAAKVAAGSAVAVAATGGIALAAATGNLPGPLQGAAHSAFGAPAAAPHTGDTTSTGSASDTDSPTDTVSPTDTTTGSDSPTSTTSAHASPSPSLTGLCKAFQAGATTHGKVIDNPAFTALVTAAGGKDHVAAYCVTLVGAAPTHPAGRPTSLPTQTSGHASDEPTTEPTDTSEPSDTAHPTGAPSTHPGRP